MKNTPLGLASLLVTCASLLVAGCASAPRASPEGELINVVAYAELANFDPITGARSPVSSTEALPGASCRLDNGDRAWTIETPGAVHVPRAPALRIECAKPGYETRRTELACISNDRRKQSTWLGLVVGLGFALGTGLSPQALQLVEALTQQAAMRQAASAPMDPDCTFLPPGEKGLLRVTLVQQ